MVRRGKGERRRGFGAEIGQVTEARSGDKVPPRDVVPVEEEEEEENISWGKNVATIP